MGKADELFFNSNNRPAFLVGCTVPFVGAERRSRDGVGVRADDRGRACSCEPRAVRRRLRSRPFVDRAGDSPLSANRHTPASDQNRTGTETARRSRRAFRAASDQWMFSSRTRNEAPCWSMCVFATAASWHEAQAAAVELMLRSSAGSATSSPVSIVEGATARADSVE